MQSVAGEGWRQTRDDDGPLPITSVAGRTFARRAARQESGFDAWGIDGSEAALSRQPSSLVSHLKPALFVLRRFASTFDERAAIYGSLGFISGVIVWHMVGFWSFVSDVVLHTPGVEQDHPAFSAVAAPTASAPDLTTGSIGQARAADKRLSAITQSPCIALVLDRANGATRQAGCRNDGHEHKDAGHQKRADMATATPRLQNSTDWATGTELKPDAEKVSFDTQDFSLEIKPAP